MKYRLGIALAIGLILSAGGAARGIRFQENEEVVKLVVPGASGWVDTGFDVEEGEIFVFRANGQIVLQKGNPEAVCGPEGYDLHGIQQPLPEENLGSLIGKVAQLVGVRLDEKTEEEIRDELVRFFYIGREASVSMPIRGRLFVGVNEDVVKDNDGEFEIEIRRKTD